jgi:lipopolysaccharide transport system ATP-binding protein
MSSETVIELRGAGKTYRRFAKPSDRFWHAIWPGAVSTQRVTDFVALAAMDMQIRRGEAVGLVGRNGAGKSTLLQLVCGTLTPSSGTVAVKGKVGALLELGAGFNPEFTGRENVYLAAAVQGLSRAQTDALFESIVEFSGIREFIDQPVKTYSSGMYVRLAFSIATSTDPDILVIDEALSVGDGAFAKKSFERIMALKEQGTTVLFCSHSLYQVEAFCDRAVWLDKGQVQAAGPVASVVKAYADSLRAEHAQDVVPGPAATETDKTESSVVTTTPVGQARITSIEVSVDGQTGRELVATSGLSEVVISVGFESDPALPCPTVATGFALPDGQIFTSVYTLFDQLPISRDAHGRATVRVAFPKLPLMKGRFTVGAYLFCERAIHVYDVVLQAATVDVVQDGVHQGFVHLPHSWAQD